jgi:biopolymer transport protein ExbB/TolQ
MSPLVQLCIVVATLAMAAIAIAAIRAMMRFEAAIHEFTRTAETVRDSVEHAEAVTRQVEEFVASMQSAVAPVGRAAVRIDELAERAMRASHAVLDEMEPPLRSTLAVLAGLRTGTRSLIGALSRRANHMQSNGGNGHE